MGKHLLNKISSYFKLALLALADFGRGASYALRH